jgi:hypothetical protein
MTGGILAYSRNAGMFVQAGIVIFFGMALPAGQADQMANGVHLVSLLALP